MNTIQLVKGLVSYSNECLGCRRQLCELVWFGYMNVDFALKLNSIGVLKLSV